MTAKANPEYMRRAIWLATQSVATGAGGPFCSSHRARRQNRGRGHQYGDREPRPTAHGEVNAIRAAAKTLGTFSLAGCELYSSCQPCPMCLAAAYWARVDRIFYGASSADAARAGFDDAFLYDEFRKEPSERKLPTTQLLGDEAWESFAAWIASDSKVKY